MTPKTESPVDLEAVERFWSKVDKSGPSGCWLWKAGKRTGGYGEFHFRGRGWASHRWLLVHTLGVDIPTSMECDHLCRTRACVNPGHIEIVLHKTNVIRGDSPTAINASATHCANGHKLVFMPGKQQRGCHRCYKKLDDEYNAVNRRRKAEYNRQYRAKNGDAINARKRARRAAGQVVK